MKNKNLFLTLFLIVISLGIGFYAGINYQRSRRSFGFNQTGQFNFQGRGGFNGINQGTRPVSGQIIKKDNDSLTVKLRDGSTKLIFLTDKTTISKSTEGTKADLLENKTVFIVGQQNSDGSITAENIQINPQPRVRNFNN